MDIKPGEITDILKREIKEYDREIDVAETGTILSSQAERDDRIVALSGGEKLPEDWFGKPWALQRAQASATGRTLRAPALWPAAPGRCRLFAQR